MASQNRKTFMAALAEYLTNNVTDLKYATYTEYFNINEDIPADKLPACIIAAGPTVIDKNITSQQYDDFPVQLTVVMSASDALDDLLDLAEKIEDELIDDPQISDTCTYCLARTVSYPTFWFGGCMSMSIMADVKLKREY